MSLSLKPTQNPGLLSEFPDSQGYTMAAAALGRKKRHTKDKGTTLYPSSFLTVLEDNFKIWLWLCAVPVLWSKCPLL